MAPRVLVIDDHVELAANIAQVLRDTLGVEVVLVADGASGLEAARAHGFDVALVDVKLPDATGVDLIEPLLACSPLGEVVVVTGHASVDVAIAALRAGAFAFLLKSFRPEELHATVNQALRKVALKRERAILEHRHRALVEGADVLIIAVSPDGALCLANPCAARLVGVEAGAVIGTRFVDRFVVAAEREAFEKAVREASRVDHAIELEAGAIDRTGAVVRVAWHLFGVREMTGGVELVYGIGRDVTDRRALERRAADAEAMAAMGSLTMGLTHAIRNPLNAAVLQLQVLGRDIARLQETERRDAMASRVGIVQDEIARIGRLLNDFLELARPRELRREWVDLSALMRRVLDAQADTMARQAVQLTAHLSEGLYVRGDVEKLRLLGMHLVSNALDAMPSGGCLSVETGVRDERAFLRITDDGAGIDSMVSREIFDPFFTTKEAGTGLGLSIVRKIVDQHGGKIDVSGGDRAGTCVHVELPCERAAWGSEDERRAREE